jgi:hypothetical protein
VSAGAQARPGWPLLVATSIPSVAWAPVLAAIGSSLLVTAGLAVLPPQGDGVLPVLGVLVLACCAAAAVDDGTHALTETAPVPVRRRLGARLLLIAPAAALGMAGVFGLAALTGVTPGQGLAVLWVSLSAVALAVGAAAKRTSSDLPATAAAAVVLVTGTVVVMWLPAAALDVAPWDSTPERVAIALVASVALLGWATRDPAA